MLCKRWPTNWRVWKLWRPAVQARAANLITLPVMMLQFNCDSFRESCVALVAEGFPCSFNKPTDGLPTEVSMR